MKTLGNKIPSKGGYTKAINLVHCSPVLSAQAKALFYELYRKHINLWNKGNTKPLIYMSIQELVFRVNAGDAKTTTKYLKELKFYGLIKWKSGGINGNANEYRILHWSAWRIPMFWIYSNERARKEWMHSELGQFYQNMKKTKGGGGSVIYTGDPSKIDWGPIQKLQTNNNKLTNTKRKRRKRLLDDWEKKILKQVKPLFLEGRMKDFPPLARKLCSMHGNDGYTFLKSLIKESKYFHGKDSERYRKLSLQTLRREGKRGLEDFEVRRFSSNPKSKNNNDCKPKL